MNTINTAVLAVFLVVASCVVAVADIATLPWTTTYDCPDVDFSDSSARCGDLSRNLGGADPCGNYEQVRAAANFPGGDGGGAQVHWYADGTNIGSGGTSLSFSSPVPEYWMRFYISWPVGFTWSSLHYDKLILVYDPDQVRFRLTSDQIGFNNGGSIIQYSPSGFGWYTMNGGSVGDGSWHYIEFHIKMDTNGNNGLTRIWVDGALAFEEFDTNWGTSSGFTWLAIGSNQDTPNNGTCVGIRYDDISIQLPTYTGFVQDVAGNDMIGPINAPGPLRSNGLPTGVQPAGTTSVTLSVTTDVAATCTYGADGDSGGTYPLANPMTPQTSSHLVHEATISGLVDGGSYSRNILCSKDSDSESNVNAYMVGWSVASAGSQHTLSVTKDETNGSGTVSSSPSGIDCGSTCSADFDDNSTVTLSASGDPVTWGGDCATDGTVDMGTANKSCTATFFHAVSALLDEPFEDADFSSRGWYDNTSLVLSSAEYAPSDGSTHSCEFHFTSGNTTPDSGGAIRRKFTPVESMHISYWVKYSSGYQGSGQSYHPHEFLIYSDQDSDYNAPNYTFLQFKVEQNALKPRVIFRDDKFVNDTLGTPPVDLVGTTENRSVHGCNGEQDGYPTNCYNDGGYWLNSKHFLYPTAVISDDTWHKIDVYVRMNTVSGSITNADGAMRYLLDDTVIFDYDDLVIRTSNQPVIKFVQFAIAPYIGDGSPIDQTFWVDNLIVTGWDGLGSCTDCGYLDGPGQSVIDGPGRVDLN